MRFIYIGKVTNTHALKGEIRILSNFEFKNKVFTKGFKLYVGHLKTEETIETYRRHKQFDMVKFVGIDNINDVIKYKGASVFINEEDLNLSNDEILTEELIGMKVYNDNSLVGNITEYREDNGNKNIRVNDKLIPFNKDFISKIDKQNKEIHFHDIGVFL
jgi:16S rRNA processing protein RimM